ncbi:MAG: DNA-directed DNA polymerase II small subunit [Candidatus Woesearchaeota archaeon]
MNPDTEAKKKEIVRYLLSQHTLVKPELLTSFSQPEQVDFFHQQVLQGVPASIILQKAQAQEFASSTGMRLQAVTQATPDSYASRVKVVFQHQGKLQKLTPQHFVNYFNARYKAIEKLLHQRSELQNLTSIGRLNNKKDRETVSIIGIVADKQTTKNENIALLLEDPSGRIKVMVSKSKPETYDAAKDIVLDEVIGISGTTGNNVLFANNIVLPDIPLTGELKKSPDEAYVAVLSCIHVGSKLFLKESFDRFIRWLRGETGNDEQRAIAAKVGYVIIAGDIIDGVGIYPNQEKELEILDIYEQYNEAARLLRMIPQNIAIIICPGNHDAGRISEPQPPISKDYAKALYELPNVIMLGNPCIVNIHSSPTFPGFDVLVYHGYSFDDYGEIVPSIKMSAKNISDRTPMIMKFLLKRRHLAPTHSSTLYYPDPEKDPLVLEKVPDIFVGGHIHKSNVDSYRGISIISCSCFQSKTPFQEKMGHEPDPGRVPVINLQTRAVKMMRF